ncbi:hypothetical protein HV110_14450 [Klebsiella oxytoca]|uniref:putative zinc ribbon protein n=1 Tax=Klebsiella oxytoca TaxID=571 RepID=UPI000DE599CD|nr:hypothetical protein [Klebsiella oxytoca]MBG2707477.1 hypothetical protein [Klebsiella oxytoca]HBM3102914.1 hypothetical protein [Klebsiella oxytoca]HEJ7347316.1 hypothetical protein [Klebsiella oxytoca]
MVYNVNVTSGVNCQGQHFSLYLYRQKPQLRLDRSSSKKNQGISVGHIHILKCYLANNSNGRFVTAKEASTSVSTPVLVPRTF